ncbi:hypothetical protein SAMN04488550_2165 [Gordonia malaquae]|nr:hypothetical protein SAMN04488550_2165 [Gordonia malaquae]
MRAEPATARRPKHLFAKRNLCDTAPPRPSTTNAAFTEAAFVNEASIYVAEGRVCRGRPRSGYFFRRTARNMASVSWRCGQSWT